MFCIGYQNSRTRTISKGAWGSIDLANNVSWLTLSKAFLASNKHYKQHVTAVFCSVYYVITLLTVKKSICGMFGFETKLIIIGYQCF